MCNPFLEAKDRRSLMNQEMLRPDLTRREDKEKRRVTIVGIGNEFRGDDSVAISVLRNLRNSIPAEVKTVELAGDQSNLIELMSDTESLIIVDAVSSPAPAGTIFQINASKESFPGDFFTVSTHSIDLAQAIELARIMRRLPELVLIYGIVGKVFSFTTSLSRQVKDSAEAVRTKILNDVDRILRSESAETF
jgi:hydrogenase maturation protease